MNTQRIEINIFKYTEYLHEKRKNKHNAELQRTAPDTKDKEAFSTRGITCF